MPPRIRFSPKLSCLRPILAEANGNRATSLFFCSSCIRRARSENNYLFSYLSSRQRVDHGLIVCRRLSSSAVAIPTNPSPSFQIGSDASSDDNAGDGRERNAVASPPVPRQEFRALHDLLEEVRDVASEHISLSRLQLAQRGLESEEPVIRIAVLGLNDTLTACRLVRLLLADPLRPKESWEDLVNSYTADDSRGLLLRYGAETSITPSHMLPTISVPSMILKKNNIEILVSSLETRSEPEGSHFVADTFLVPTITIGTSHSGRRNAVRYPVHKSIICGSGVGDLLAYSRIMFRSDLDSDASSIHGVIDLPVGQEETKGNSDIAIVDTRQADEALRKFRESVENAADYEHGWTTSGVEALVKWFSTDRKNDLSPALEKLIISLLDAAERGVLSRKLREQKAVTVSDEVRSHLFKAISEWAERAHRELQESLEEGFATKRWRGLAWWKLFWRVDDVGAITSEILEQRYLRQAEREVIWVAGRLRQAGLLNPSVPALDALVEDPGPVKGYPPWPMEIAESRTKLRASTVSSLQALSQSLVFFSLSTTTLTSALSVLLYISMSTSMYEAGTVAAVGFVYSLRRQQKKWVKARTFWENEVREAGRSALKETEDQLRTWVHHGGRAIEAGTEQYAKTTIERAREALECVRLRGL
ncbi:hypothetical protein Egran_05930 [Elaphomyces granulatus]|uniref:Mmc1 C-terminal domain-containing protein n=1 Tax=Elaphomyces granulatus TaxID=519963 RepID=A0A232LQ55_9EURO|nr:hypothetical protein Egran_05930 [Elaphomyces granulatus]